MVGDRDGGGRWAIPTLASAQNVVYACVGNVSKVARIVGATGKCISSPPVLAETPMQWDVHGLPGAPGTNGTNGTNGINGTSVTVSGSLLPGDTHCSNGGASACWMGAPATRSTFVTALTGRSEGDAGGGPCFDNFNRYVDCGNGTVTDTVTGLIWLQDAACTALGNPPGWGCFRGVGLGRRKPGGCRLEGRRLRADGRIRSGRLASPNQGRVERDDGARGRARLSQYWKRPGADERRGDPLFLSVGAVVVCGRGVAPRLLLVEHLE